MPLQVSTATGGATEIAAGAVPPPEGLGPAGVSLPPPAGLPEAGSGGGAARVLALAGAGAVLQLYDATAGRALARLQVGSLCGSKPGLCESYLRLADEQNCRVSVDMRAQGGESQGHAAPWSVPRSPVSGPPAACLPPQVVQWLMCCAHCWQPACCSAQTSSLCFAVQVGQQAPAVAGGRQGPGAALQHVAASADGALLVTVDVRQDAGLQVCCVFLCCS